MGPGGSRRTAAPAGSLPQPTAAAARAPHAHSPARAGAAILALISGASPPGPPVPRRRRRRRPGSDSDVSGDAAADPAPPPSTGGEGGAAQSREGAERRVARLGGTHVQAPARPRGEGRSPARRAAQRGVDVHPAAAFGAWQGASRVSSELLRRELAPTRPYFLECPPLRSNWLTETFFLQNLPKTGIENSQENVSFPRRHPGVNSSGGDGFEFGFLRRQSSKKGARMENAL